jgi:hypothetical protein
MLPVSPEAPIIRLLQRRFVVGDMIYPAPPEYLYSFHPEMVLLPNLCVKLRACLCDVLQYVSAQALVFLDLGQNPSFPISKLD